MSLNNEKLFILEEIYKGFGSVPRLKILIRLIDGEASANELTAIAKLSQSATSHQLKDLKQKKIIKCRKEGLNIFYSLNDAHIVEMLKNGIEHILED